MATRKTSKNTEQVLKIRAAVLRRRGSPLTIETLEMEEPRDDEVLVRIVASGICHTDIRYIEDWYGESEGPLILGHEGAGIVERVGPKVTNLRRGDHVVMSYQSCGHCPQCRRGRPFECRYMSELNWGFQRSDGSNALQRSGVKGHFFGQSSFATHALSTGRNAVKVSKALPLEMLAPLGCGLQTGAGTVMNSLGVSSGASITVFGTGAVGLAAVMAARIVGANPVIGIDIIPRRLKLARELGATHSIDGRREDVASRIQTIAGGGVDYTMETTDNDEMYRLSLDLLNPKGTAALVTGASGPARLPGGRKTVSIVEGDAVPQEFIPKLIAFWRKGLFPFDRLVKFYDFKDINRAIAEAKRGSTIKPVLRISEAQDFSR
jgi:aryl-alcohol dehydrogenase